MTIEDVKALMKRADSNGINRLVCCCGLSFEWDGSTVRSRRMGLAAMNAWVEWHAACYGQTAERSSSDALRENTEAMRGFIDALNRHSAALEGMFREGLPLLPPPAPTEEALRHTATRIMEITEELMRERNAPTAVAETSAPVPQKRRRR